MKSAIGVALALLALTGTGATAQRVRRAAGAQVAGQRVRPAAGAPAPASWSLKLGPEEQVDPGKLHNAPNGHISFESGRGALTVWVAGRLQNGNRQGTFLLHPRSWSTADLESASPTLVFQAPHNGDPCNAPDGFYRNYAAINAIIPGPQPGQLLAFIDGEFHPDTTARGGLPLLASIGLATSTDGVHWTVQGQIIQGLDASIEGCQAVVKAMTRRQDDEGAAGPTAIVRSEGGTKYIYVYYEDRIRLTQPATAPSANLYVARSLFAGGGAPGTWQKWTGSGWSAAGDQKHAAPIIRAPQGTGEAAHAEVSYNSQLARWLMVFHTRRGLYTTSTQDGTSWDPPALLTASTTAVEGAFPTLVTESASDQMTTGASGSLFYSRKEGSSYIGYRRSFTVLRTVAAPPRTGGRTPQQRCLAAGGTWTGNRCQ